MTGACSAPGCSSLANVALGASIVVYNSFLPQLAGPDERDRVSSIGWAIGYIGGGLLLLLNLVVLTLRRHARDVQGSMVARCSIVSAGVWWAAFTTLPLLRLQNRPAVAGEADRVRCSPTGSGSSGTRCGNDARVPADALVPGRLPDLQRRHPDRHHAWPASTPTRSCSLTQNVQIETILLVQFLAFGGALLLGRLARRYGAWKTVARQPRRLWTVVVGIAYFLPAHKPLLFMALGAADRHRARRQPGAEPVAVQPADPARARRPSTSASTRSPQAAPPGSGRCCSAWRTRSPAATGSRSSR